MASKNEISKRLKSAKEGKPTWQDKARLKTWKAYKAGSQKMEGYRRAERNIKKDKQMGRKPNEVDLQIVKSYVPQTKDQMKADRIKAAIWATGLVGGPVAGKGLGLAAKAAAKKITGSAAKKAAAKKAAAKKAAAKREAANAKRRVARARAAAEAKKTMDLARIAGETGRRVGHDKIVKAAGTRAANREAKKHAATQTAKRGSEQAAKILRNQKLAVAGLASVPIVAGGVAALRGDKPKKPEAAAAAAAAKPKPRAADKTRSPSRAHPEKGIGAGRERAAEKKRLARSPSRADPVGGIGVGRKAEKERKDAAAAKKEKRGYDFFKGGEQKVTLPKWLGGSEITVDSSDKAFDYMDAPELNLKRGGRLKKRATLRGHRAELRGG
jgi:hypothetical protein